METYIVLSVEHPINRLPRERSKGKNVARRRSEDSVVAWKRSEESVARKKN